MKPGVETAHAPHAADHLGAHVGQHLPEEALVREARHQLERVVGLAVVGRHDARELARAVERLDGLRVAAVEVGRRAGQAGDVTPHARQQRLVVRHAHVRAARLVHVHLGPADVERGDLGALRALDERRARDDHVGLLGHVDAVADERHVAAARDAVAEHARHLRHARVAQQAVHLEDVPCPALPGEAPALLGQVEPAAVHQVERGQAQLERDALRALDLLGRAWPPRAGGHRVVVGDDHAEAPVHAPEHGDDAGRGARELPELLAVVHERAHLEERAALVAQRHQALTRGHLLLLVHARGVLLSPALAHLGAARFELGLEFGVTCAQLAEGQVVHHALARVAHGCQLHERHQRASLAGHPGMPEVS
jgi:hypothetical protein